MENGEVKLMRVADIREEAPFKDLFAIDPSILEGIERDMAEHGYDGGHPLVLWKETGTVVDGHTRLRAARNLLSRNEGRGSSINGELDSIPVVEHSFASEEEAVKYAIRSQTERRNLTDWGIFYLVKKYDERSTNWGGKRHGDQAQASFGDPKLDSRKTASEIVAVSKHMVSMCRHIRDKCDEKAWEAIRKEEKSINQVYNQSREGRRKERARYLKQEQRQEMLAEVAANPALAEIKGYDGRERLVSLRLDLLPQLLKMGQVMESIKTNVEFFSNQEGGLRCLASENELGQFLKSDFVADFIWVLEAFGFEVKRPEEQLLSQAVGG